MNNKVKNIVLIIVMSVCLFGSSLVSWTKKSTEISDSERRKLEQFPEIKWEDIWSGEFMTDFEKYTLDQFPHRDDIRRVKALAQFNLFRQKDNNNIYVVDGIASALQYPLNEASVETAAVKLRILYEKYLEGKDMDIYYSIVPDKNYYMAEANGYPAMDYERLVEIMRENDSFMQYVDLFDSLEIGDYYATDTHWRQEHLENVVKKISEAMKISDRLPTFGDYTIKEQGGFYGVLYGQSALPLSSESIYYLTNDTLDACTVYNYERNKYTSIYDMEKATSRDLYELFLSGATALLTIENPNATTDEELIVFRDSFGSSLIPLLVEGYAKVTIIDIRYIATDYIEGLVDFDNQDVLFLYSTLVLNSSNVLK